MLGNVNNDLNAQAKRRAIARMFEDLKGTCDKMNAMLETFEWASKDEKDYERLRGDRGRTLARLRASGQFIA